ncbi:Pectate lyase superfamily protein [Pelomyxa schiedti]|nr:Pectate lyase superfamily protein [Pelomyxa schiedti]
MKLWLFACLLSLAGAFTVPQFRPTLSHKSRGVPVVGDLFWYQWGYVNARDAPYNATGDGASDDTAAIQSALNSVGASGGGIVFLPAGNYAIYSHLTIPPDTTLKGVASAPSRSCGTLTEVHGTTLFAYEGKGSDAGTPFIFLQGSNSGVEGFSIFYPEQIEANPPYSYPWTIGGSGDDLSVQNMLLLNSYQGIDFATNPCGRHWIRAVYGQPLKTGIVVDQCYDIGRIMDIHFWPFWSMSDAIFKYQHDNAVVEDVFSWGYNIGMQFAQSANGACNGQFTDINFDDVDIGLDIQTTQEPGIIFDNLNLANAGDGSHKIGVWGHNGDSSVVIRGASVWGVFNQFVLWQSAGHILVSASLINSWNSAYPAIQIDSGRAMIQGNYFHDVVGTAIKIGSGTDRVMVTDNELVGNSVSNSGTLVLMADNHN